MPTLDALQARLGGSDFHVLPLSIDRAGLEPVRRFYRETGIRNLDLYIAEDTRAMLALAVVGLPTTILIDRIGREDTIFFIFGPSGRVLCRRSRVVRERHGMHALTAYW